MKRIHNQNGVYHRSRRHNRSHLRFRWLWVDNHAIQVIPEVKLYRHRADDGEQRRQRILVKNVVRVRQLNVAERTDDSHNGVSLTAAVVRGRHSRSRSRLGFNWCSFRHRCSWSTSTMLTTDAIQVPKVSNSGLVFDSVRRSGRMAPRPMKIDVGEVSSVNPLK